jgi:hypothetical protein
VAGHALTDLQGSPAQNIVGQTRRRPQAQGHPVRVEQVDRARIDAHHLRRLSRDQIKRRIQI